MGTRNITGIVMDNEIKLSQYGQWDGYFEYSGKEFIKFCKEELVYDWQINDFKNKVDLLKAVSDEEYDKFMEIYKQHQDLMGTYCIPINQLYPQFSRDTGVKILDIINSLVSYEMRDKKFPVENEVDVHGGCLFDIEFVNILDLDNNVLYFLTYHVDKNIETIDNDLIKDVYCLKGGLKCYLKIKLEEVKDLDVEELEKEVKRKLPLYYGEVEEETETV